MRFTALQFAMFRRGAALVVLWTIAVLAVGFWILVSPANPVTAYFSAPMTVRDAHLIDGPFPRESDYAVLKRNGVTTIVSLLDPRLPYERVLLSREQTLAAENGMTVDDFPMGSILSRNFGDDYESHARAAAHAIAIARGRVYLHCYLGMHRVASVEAILEKSGEATASSGSSHGERTADASLLDEAQNAYDSGNYKQTLRLLFDVVDKSEASQILAGWADYRLDDIRQASDDFSSALRIAPGSEGAITGLGYCSLRDGDLDAASSRFAAALAKSPRDVSALTGMGLTRYRQGRTDEAAHYLRTSLAIDPRDADARSALSRI